MESERAPRPVVKVHSPASSSSDRPPVHALHAADAEGVESFVCSGIRAMYTLFDQRYVSPASRRKILFCFVFAKK